MLQKVINDSLTRSEKKLIEVLLNPDNRYKSIKDICNISKISRETYYRAFEKDNFVNEYKRLSLQLARQSVMPIIQSFIKEATRGSFQHGKILLEMAGMYTEKQEIEHSGEMTQVIKNDDEEAARRILADIESTIKTAVKGTGKDTGTGGSGETIKN